MAKVSQEPLQPNPFMTYRDPQTGKWMVIKDNCGSETITSRTYHSPNNGNSSPSPSFSED